MQLVVFQLCFIWVVSILLAAVYCGVSFSQRRFRVLWPLKFLRFGAAVTTTGLFIPISSVLLSAFQCTDNVWHDQWQCWQGSHLLFAVAVVCIVPLFAGLSVVVVATFIDRSPDSGHVLAKVHGRVAAIMLAVKFALTLAFTFKASVGTALLTAACMMSGLAWYGLAVLYQPFYSGKMNNLEAAAGAVQVWASSCLIMTQVLSYPDNAAFAFWAALPFVVYCGYHSPQARRASVLKGELDAKSAFMVEQKGRFLLQDATGPGRVEAVSTVQDWYKHAMTQVCSPSASLR